MRKMRMKRRKRYNIFINKMLPEQVQIILFFAQKNNVDITTYEHIKVIHTLIVGKTYSITLNYTQMKLLHSLLAEYFTIKDDISGKNILSIQINDEVHYNFLFFEDDFFKNGMTIIDNYTSIIHYNHLPISNASPTIFENSYTSSYWINRKTIIQLGRDITYYRFKPETSFLDIQYLHNSSEYREWCQLQYNKKNSPVWLKISTNYFCIF